MKSKFLFILIFLSFISCMNTVNVSQHGVNISKPLQDVDIRVTPGLSDKMLTIIRNGFESRRREMMKQLEKTPFPDTDDHEEISSYTWTKLSYSISRLYLNEEIDKANNSIITAMDNLLAHEGIFFNYENHENAIKQQNTAYIEDYDRFIFVSNIVTRVYELFNQNSKFSPHSGKLDSAAEKKIVDVLRKWVTNVSRIDDADKSINKIWYIWGSENYHSMRNSTCWGATKILKSLGYEDEECDDGKTINEHYEAWRDYFKVCLSELAKKGLLVEIASGYVPYTMQGWYNMYDFAEDPVLKKKAKNLLHLWWAHWAQEQVDGVHGGSKARNYPGIDSQTVGHSTYPMSWYYFGDYIESGLSIHPKFLCLATSEYRLPFVIMDIALDITYRGSYEVTSRRLGLNGKRPNDVPYGNETYILNPDYGGILRYTYVTPDFIIGTSMLDKLPAESWAPISSQNRWQGIIIAGKRKSRSIPDTRIYPQCCCAPGTNKTYNQQWAVQYKGTMIVQKLKTNLYAEDMRVWFPGNGFTITEENNWIFCKNDRAYIAVRPVSTKYAWSSWENSIYEKLYISNPENNESGIGGFDLKSFADCVFPFDYNGDEKDDLFCYRPGKRTAYILKSECTKDTFRFRKVAGEEGAGFAGYDMSNINDRVFAFDFDRDRNDDIFMYRPGSGAVYIVKSEPGDKFKVKYGKGGNPDHKGPGFGGFKFENTGDRVFPFDYNGDGKDDLFLYSPGKGTVYILKSECTKDTFRFRKITGDEGTGFAGYDMRSIYDRAFAFDYNKDGNDDIFMYRPGIGAAWIVRSDANDNFEIVYGIGGNFDHKGYGIGGFDLRSFCDCVFPFNYDGDKTDDLFFYRPGYGIAFIAKRSNYEWNDWRNWMWCEWEYAPVIFEIVRNRDYKTFKDFKNDICNNKLYFKSGVLEYESLYDSTKLEFYTDINSHKRPKINSKPIDLEPNFTIRSDYIWNETWAGGTYYIKKGDRELKLVF